jgi:hypothetical protein
MHSQTKANKERKRKKEQQLRFNAAVDRVCAPILEEYHARMELLSFECIFRYEALERSLKAIATLQHNK